MPQELLQHFQKIQARRADYLQSNVGKKYRSFVFPKILWILLVEKVSPGLLRFRRICEYFEWRQLKKKFPKHD